MESDNNQPTNEAAKAQAKEKPTTWESKGLLIKAHKSLDAGVPPTTIDMASTLGASNDLPLAVKKAVRYWFEPHIKTKTDVVRYVNEVCRQNGFKISTLSNSKQGLDRRAQLVCSRGLIARKPRGKSQNLQTTTTRPVSNDDKCPFSLTVYECRKSGRWYIRKFGNGNKMHCGHCQLLPEQVGVRRFQNLTERVGSGWCNATSESPSEKDKKNGEAEGEKSSAQDPNTKEAAKNALASPQMIRMGMFTESSLFQNQTTETPVFQNPSQSQILKKASQNQMLKDQSENQILNYINGLRDRIAYRNYNEQLLLERARRYQDIEAEMNRLNWPGSNSIGHRRYLDVRNDVQDEINNSSNELLMDRIRALSQSISTNVTGGLLESTRLSNDVGIRELASLIESNRIGRSAEDRVREEVYNIGAHDLPSLLDLIGARAQNGVHNINKKSTDTDISHGRNQHRLSNLSNTETKNIGDCNDNDGEKIRKDDNCRLQQSKNVHHNEAVRDPKVAVDNSVAPIHDASRRPSENGKINSSTISKSVVQERALPENVGSNTSARSRINDPHNHSEGLIEQRKETPNNSNNSLTSTVVADRIESDISAKSIEEHNTAVDEYAMLRPMAIYHYPSNSEIPDNEGDEIQNPQIPSSPHITDREGERKDLEAETSKHGRSVDSSLAEETEQCSPKRRKLEVFS